MQGVALRHLKPVRAMDALCAPFWCHLVPRSVTNVLSGMVRGCGRQVQGLHVNLVALWLMALPLSCVLGLTLRMGAPGLWAGQVVGSFLQAAAFGALALRLDWRQEARRARRRVEQSQGPSGALGAAGAGAEGGAGSGDGGDLAATVAAVFGADAVLGSEGAAGGPLAVGVAAIVHPAGSAS